MKRFTLLAALAICLPAHAERDFCAELGKMAYKAAQARQVGVPMSELMRATNGLEIAQTIVASAYNQRRYYTEENQQRAAEDHQAHWEVACYKATKNKTAPVTDNQGEL